MLHGFAVDDLETVELGDWPRTGGRGSYIDLDGEDTEELRRVTPGVNPAGV